ncbi:GlxA family transcriptional regulator [Algihabitans sp.]|uniref:GlxA family transcriptional regulator n=1 Tax=Algihabitans sp. TaxID=2821514 RepID=UPI003BAC6B68
MTRKAVQSKHKPRRVAITVLPRFPLMAFAGLIEPLRVANLLGGAMLYDYVVLGTAGRRTRPSCGLAMSCDGGLEDASHFDRVVLCSGGDAADYKDARLMAWLRREARGGADMGAVADASFLLARAGLLDGRRCTAHWQSQAAFREAYPKARVESAIFVLDRDRFTSAGGSGAFDMTLALIERDHGRPLARAVAQWFVHERAGEDVEREPLALRTRTGLNDPILLLAVASMEAQMESLPSIAEIAHRCGVSPEALRRRFRAQTGETPLRYFRRLRLERARQLLSQADLKVSEVAVACGFASPAQFSRAFHAAFGHPPRRARDAFLSHN